MFKKNYAIKFLFLVSLLNVTSSATTQSSHSDSEMDLYIRHLKKREAFGAYDLASENPQKKRKLFQPQLKGVRIGLIEEESFNDLFSALMEKEDLKQAPLIGSLQGHAFYQLKKQEPGPWEDFFHMATHQHFTRFIQDGETNSSQKSGLFLVKRTIEEKTVHFVIPFGGGFRLVSTGFLEPDFGLQVACGGVNPEAIKGYTHVRRGSQVRKTNEVGFQPCSQGMPSSSSDKVLRSLRDKTYNGKGPYIFVNKKIDSLEKLGLVCDKTYNLFSQIKASTEFSNFIPVKQLSTLRLLNAELLKDHTQWSLFAPEFCTIDEAEKCFLNHSQKDLPLETIFQKLRTKNIPKIFDNFGVEEERLKRLKSLKITYEDSEGNREKFSIYEHIQFDTSLQSHRYSLHDGTWYMVQSKFRFCPVDK